MVETDIKTLKRSTQIFIDIIENWEQNNPANYLDIISAIHDLCKAITFEELSGENPRDIKNELNNLRHIHSRSPFIKRLQDWPRGYAGDFETIEYICNCKNKATKHSVEYFLEEYALKCSIAQQHRNKVNIQSNYVLDTILNKKNPRILIVGCGNGRDIRNIQKLIEKHDFQLVFNDLDKDAIEFTKSNLNEIIKQKSEFITSNIIKLTKKEKNGNKEFELILFGGVFDYLSDKVIKFLLRNMYSNLLSNDGKILFTNIIKNNPFRVWIEYLANWKLIERSKQDCIDICIASGIENNNIRIFKDETNLTNIVEISKPR